MNTNIAFQRHPLKVNKILKFQKDKHQEICHNASHNIEHLISNVNFGPHLDKCLRNPDVCTNGPTFLLAIREVCTR